jgi:hypothetical protein
MSCGYSGLLAEQEAATVQRPRMRACKHCLSRALQMGITLSVCVSTGTGIFVTGSFHGTHEAYRLQSVSYLFQ